MRSYDLAKVFYGLGGGVRQSLKFSDVALLPVLLPPEEEQEIIANYLDRETKRIDELIAEQRGLIETLRERRLSLISRALLGLNTTRESTVRELRLVGSHGAVEQLLHRLPLHWGITRFKWCAVRRVDRNVGLAYPMASLKVSGAVVLRSSRGNNQDPDESNLPKYLVVHPDQLVVNPMWLVGGAIGVSAIGGAVSPDYRVFDIGKQHLPRYLHYVLRSKPYFDQYKLYTRAQTTFDRRVQQPDLDNLPLPIPPLEEQREIVVYLDDETSRIDALITESEDLIALSQEQRAALITAAVTGQIDVRTAA